MFLSESISVKIFDSMFPRDSKHEDGLSSAFEREFALEILKSDRLRVTILGIAILSFLPLILLLLCFFLDHFQRAFHGNFKGFLATVGTFMAIVLTCLTVERLVIDYLINNQGKSFDSLQYISAFVETSIPTIGMLLGISFLGPIYTLFTPAPFFYPIFIVLSALRLNSKLCVFTGAVAAIEYSLLAVYVTRRGPELAIEPILTAVPPHFFKGFLLFLMGVVTGFVTLQIRKRILSSFEIVDERNRISRTFGEHVSPVVMNKLLTLKPDLRSEKRSVCVMFLDIRDFTAFSERRTPEEVVDYLESLFEFMIEIINRHHGIINKFLGDGFMAVFGAPLSEGTDCQNAVAASKEILARVESEVEQGRILPTSIGIGLHAGEAVTGSIGSSIRREYTVIGDVVNLASRIEQLNKQFKSKLLVSEMVRDVLASDLPEAVPMGHVQVKGREAAVQVYRVA